LKDIHKYLKDERYEELLANVVAKDVMTSPVYCLFKGSKMSDAKRMMKKKRISGIPIVDEENHLLGIISIEDMIKALEGNWLDDPIENHMAESVVHFHEGDDIRSIMEFFLTYNFGRFPVVDDDNRVVGLLTKGDLSFHLLERFGRVYLHNKRRDDLLNLDRIHFTNLEKLQSEKQYEYTIEKPDIQDAGIGSVLFKKFLAMNNVHDDIIKKACISLYEAEVNVVLHAFGTGEIKAYIADDIILVMVSDEGPGIEDVDRAMQEGFSTASDEVRELGFGAGMGLPNMRNNADKMIILSSSKGTKIEMMFYMGAPPLEKPYTNKEAEANFRYAGYLDSDLI